MAGVVKIWLLAFGICFCILLLILPTSKVPVQEKVRSQTNLRYQPTVGIVSMQRNEADILPYWLHYHVALFGIENVVILDSYSNNETLIILREWSSRGLKVQFNQGPYGSKGNLTVAAFQQFFPRVDIALPLDGDEFLVGFNNSVPVINKNKILNELKEFWQSDSSCWGMEQSYHAVNLFLNETVQSVRYFSPNVNHFQASKKIIKRKYLVSLDASGQKVDVSVGRCSSAYNRIGLLHYHFRNGTLTAERALNDIIHSGWLPPSVNLTNCHSYFPYLVTLSKDKKIGRHKLKELFLYIKNGPSAFLHNVHPSFIQIEPVDRFPYLLADK
jgi:hypothetical protein